MKKDSCLDKIKVTEIKEGGKMKKRILTIFLIFTLVIPQLFACEDPAVSISYVYRNGEEPKTVVLTEENLGRPEDPEREGYVFLGWSTDPDALYFYDFSELPSESIMLYAVWLPDYEKLSERISSEAMTANVKISSEYYSVGIAPSATSQGSGVIFYENSTHYYVLTNHHVLHKDGDYFYTDYFVYDAYGNKYIGELLDSDPKYDLGVLRIRKLSSVSLSSLKISESVPDRYETVASLGSPKGQFNSVTLGEVSNYKVIEQTDGSEVEFEVIWHTAYANHGSSGGALVNTCLELVGINFAVATNEKSEFMYCVAVPGAKIAEYLSSSGFTYVKA